MSRPFFVVSAARSGSTSLAKILDCGSNTVCLSEPIPTLGRQSRQLRERARDDAAELVRRHIVTRAKGVADGTIYGEKNVTLAPFASELVSQLDANFVHLFRDGRDVVRSLMTWHMALFGSVYREAASDESLSPTARAAAARLLMIDDESDYARHRPLSDRVGGRRWLELNRFEMCAYYWAAANSELLEVVADLSRDNAHRLDYTTPTARSVLQLADSLGVRGLTQTQVQELLDQRVNSVMDRGGPGSFDFRRWTEWNSAERDQFASQADAMMTALEMWSPATRWRPPAFGSFWDTKGPDEAWFQWMFDHRSAAHDDLRAFVDTRSEFTSFCDVGCGIAVGYSELMKSKRFRGVDVSSPNIEWCRLHRQRIGHDYVVEDVCNSTMAGPETFDLVFSQGTIDNAYDIDAFLTGMVRRSRHSIYVTAYRGWFPHLDEHTYSYNESQGCFYNDVSPSRARRTLEQAGAFDIEVTSLPTGDASIPLETRIVARVPG